MLAELFFEFLDTDQYWVDQVFRGEPCFLNKDLRKANQ
jgi:hypothetical protein